MIYLFYGTDIAKTRVQVNKTILAGQKKHPAASFFKLTPDNFSEDKLEELIASQGLFYSAFIVLADNLLADKIRAEIIIKKVEAISQSPNFFIFWEKKLNKKEMEMFKKYAVKSEEHSLPVHKLTKKEIQILEGEKIDFFDFSDALGARDKKLLWTLYQTALAEDVASEEVHAIFFWQIKSMLCTVKAKTATEAGINPFVFNKAKGYAKNYNETLLEEMVTKLFNMYHLAHRGKIDFAVALEKFILEL